MDVFCDGDMTAEERQRFSDLMHELLGDDLDCVAAELEDAEFMLGTEFE